MLSTTYIETREITITYVLLTKNLKGCDGGEVVVRRHKHEVEGSILTSFWHRNPQVSVSVSTVSNRNGKNIY